MQWVHPTTFKKYCTETWTYRTNKAYSCTYMNSQSVWPCTWISFCGQRLRRTQRRSLMDIEISVNKILLCFIMRKNNNRKTVPCTASPLSGIKPLLNALNWYSKRKRIQIYGVLLMLLSHPNSTDYGRRQSAKCYPLRYTASKVSCFSQNKAQRKTIWRITWTLRRWHRGHFIKPPNICKMEFAKSKHRDFRSTSTDCHKDLN